jgi:hypothetical protein
MNWQLISWLTKFTIVQGLDVKVDVKSFCIRAPDGTELDEASRGRITSAIDSENSRLNSTRLDGRETILDVFVHQTWLIVEERANDD